MSQQLEGGSRSSSPSPQPPVLSVVTVVFNDKEELEAIIENMKSFRSDMVEFVVVDGGSTDGSLDVLRSQASHIDYWLSEPDQGIYDAMNKGMSVARGTWVIHINAGDRVLSLPVDLLSSFGDTIDVLACQVDCFDYVFKSTQNWTSRFQNRVHHQGAFYRRAVHFGYDPTYKIMGDFCVNQKMLRTNFRFAWSDDVVASHRLGGLSGGELTLKEQARSVRENYGLFSALLLKFFFVPLQAWSQQRARNKRNRAAEADGTTPTPPMVG